MNKRTLFAAAAVALALGPAAAYGIGSATFLSLLAQACISAILALGVGLLLRQNGMVSFGHALWYGGAAYAVAILLQAGVVSAETAVLLAVAGAAAGAFVVGLVIVRVPGIAFGMLTLALGQMAFLTASRNRGLTGGADGLTVEWPATLFGAPVAALVRPSTLLIVTWSTLVLLLLLVSLRTRFGAITEAVRDNEERARFIGIRTLLPRAAVYALSAAVSAVGGVLASLNTGFVSPESVHWSLSGTALMMVVVGGTRVLWGPVLGAAVYVLAKDALGDHAQHWMAIFGTALIVAVVFAPQGLSGIVVRAARRLRGRPAPAPVAAPRPAH